MLCMLELVLIILTWAKGTSNNDVHIEGTHRNYMKNIDAGAKMKISYVGIGTIRKFPLHPRDNSRIFPGSLPGNVGSHPGYVGSLGGWCPIGHFHSWSLRWTSFSDSVPLQYHIETTHAAPRFEPQPGNQPPKKPRIYPTVIANKIFYLG